MRRPVTAYFHCDPLGSADRLTDASQVVTDSYLYKAFGDLVARMGATVSPFRFIGRLGYYWNSDISNYLLSRRFHDGSLGRFLSPDPLYGATFWGDYAYAKNHPLRFVDPSGLQLVVSVGQPANIGANCFGYDLRVRIRHPSGWTGATLYMFQHITLKQETCCCAWTNQPPSWARPIPGGITIAGPLACQAVPPCTTCVGDFFEHLNYFAPNLVIDRHIHGPGIPQVPGICAANIYTTITVHVELRAYGPTPLDSAGTPVGPLGSIANQATIWDNLYGSRSNRVNICGIAIRANGRAGPPPWFWAPKVVPWLQGGYMYTMYFDCCSTPPQIVQDSKVQVWPPGAPVPAPK